MPKLNKQTLGSTMMRVARVFLGSTLLLSVLWASMPASAVATGPLCTLACCAGRAPHAAGSCMNGSCHVFLGNRGKGGHIHPSLPAQSEQLCGLPRTTARTAVALLQESKALTLAASSEQSRVSNLWDSARVSAASLGKQCQPDCGGGPCSSSGQRRSRDSGATSYADKPRPPSSARLEHSSFNLAKASDALCRRSRPRGPPISPS